MSDELPEDYSAIDRMLDSSEFEAARGTLSGVDQGDARYAALRIKLALLTHELPPGAAMQRLIQLMRDNPDHPGAKAVYQLASAAAYQGRESSVAHSHPPPPATKTQG